MNVKFMGKAISNPILAFVALMVGVVVAACVLPLHPLFWVTGRRGVLRNHGTEVIFDKTSFERV
ncbi:hypothetical protein AB8A05_04035 [Tardiphaga sp. 538_B7_N1_4]|uniref:hypothetical protein n=1 Tax=Tardiphaga sp. 538_B7_N1_4 TaxID=3240778 RepID=UPI003F28A37F